ncbi:hypothetical protein [Aliivibrio fischeri]|uniref:hypothetical protein n=1 Tax=Aliivibrio fischeri TaxID=668 RepID=UPI0012D9C038|nr:hypothetical protein [Aliivibrio fischeri]MUI55247.1 hypothetical protein [Aliivibrio fischeri]MUJ19208.1 hypothetical protein [Aliivibrio fischeri]MUL17045.1 hypothetical protein [Aliivibrio fischeri]
MNLYNKSRCIAEGLVSKGNKFFFATPCGVLAPLLNCLEKTETVITYIPREDNAIAIACGVFTKGERAIVFMQNSGFAQSINVLASLVIPYCIPIQLIISMRGTGVDNTLENKVMGNITEKLLRDLSIDYRIIQKDSFEDDIQWMHENSLLNKKATALLITPDFFDWSK